MVSLPRHHDQAPRRKYRRRAIVLVSILHVRVYLDMLEQNKVVSPIPCPDGCRGHWWAHSWFQRDWVDADCTVFRLIIVRVQCGGCRGVWSLFPSFVWYRFRFSYRVVQAACYSLLSDVSPVAVARQLELEVSPILVDQGRARVPAENTIRSWLKWLGSPLLEQLVRWTLSLIGQISPESARAIVPALTASRQPAGPAGDRIRAGRFLKMCAALQAVRKGGTNFFRRSPYQLRDWAADLFCERRQILARAP
jgi:hypothetical protein